MARWVGVSAGAHLQCGQVSWVVSWFGGGWHWDNVDRSVGWFHGLVVTGTGSREGRYSERHNIVMDEERIDSYHKLHYLV